MTVSRLRLLAVLLAASASLLLVACDSGEEEHNHADHALTLGLTWDPATPTTGQNRLVVMVTDTEGAAVTGASVSVDLLMPSMGHGSSETAVITELGAGEYEAFPVTFQMPGEWSIEVSAVQDESHGTKSMMMNIGGEMAMGEM